MTRRPAVTLIEVLVAIFIMGIGMLALLVLFPLGALNMAQAIKDDRCAQAAAQAVALANARGLRADNNVYGTRNADGSPNLLGLRDGYPVYIDPLGVKVAGMTASPWNVVGGSAIPRRSATYLGNALLARQWCSLLDDLTFDPESGLAALPNGSNVSREGRYTWAYMARPLLGSPSATSEVRSLADLDVVVYSGRNLDVKGGETAYQATLGSSATSITLNYGVGYGGSEKPALRRGNWILDASPSTGVETNVFGAAHSFFYRVVSVEDTSTTAVQLELQTPLLAATSQVGPTISKVVVLDNVAEVFSKRTGWLP
jgi:type II secretory pathway pseudopilin PulG